MVVAQGEILSLLGWLFHGMACLGRVVVDGLKRRLRPFRIPGKRSCGWLPRGKSDESTRLAHHRDTLPELHLPFCRLSAKAAEEERKSAAGEVGGLAAKEVARAAEQGRVAARVKEVAARARAGAERRTREGRLFRAGRLS
jgi:hypothetical protein